MSLRCPVCRAWVALGPQCRRCRADLSLLFELANQRDRDLAAAWTCAAAGDSGRAVAYALRADALCHDPDSQTLLAMAHLLQGTFSLAWQHYRTRKVLLERSAHP